MTYYVASVRKPGDLCADADIFESRDEADQFISQNAQDRDYVHVEECSSKKAAEEEFEYQTGTSFG